MQGFFFFIPDTLYIIENLFFLCESNGQAIDLTRCWEILGEITGDAAPDELITQLFSQFCLGK